MDSFYHILGVFIKKYLLLIFSVVTFVDVAAQEYVIKTDIPGWATASINIEPEMRLASCHSLALGLSYNAWNMNSKTNMKWRHIFIQPEYRYWFSSAFNGHFVAAHVAYMHYNIGGLRNNLNLHFARMLSERRFQGDFTSFGLGYGYRWFISKVFSLEAELGLGVAWTGAKSYRCETCGDYIGYINKWFFTPTKFSLSCAWVIL